MSAQTKGNRNVGKVLQVMGPVVDVIFESVGPDRGCVMLLDQPGRRLVPKVRRTRQGARHAGKITISKTILDYVLDNNEGVLTTDARDDQRWNPAASIVQAGIREAICVPMRGRYDVVGVIYVDTSTTAQEALQQGLAAKFTQDHLKLMVTPATTRPWSTRSASPRWGRPSPRSPTTSRTSSKASAAAAT